MLVYVYDEETKEFLREEEAFVDPLETELKGEEVYLLPANATFEKPFDKQEGEAVVFNKSTWTLIDDNRGKFTIKDNQIEEIKTLDPVEKILTDKEAEGLKDGTLVIIDNEVVEKPAPTHEEIQETRRQLYIAQKDPITCQIQSLRDEEQTEEIIAEIEALKAERSAIVEKIKSENPYPEETEE